MEKVKFLQSVKTMLDASGFSVEDLAELYGVKIVLPEMKSDAPERGSLVFDSEGNFRYGVVYEGNVVSFKPLEGQKVLGICFENKVITLKDAPQKMSWPEAKAYCQQMMTEGKKMTPGSYNFWLNFKERANAEVINAMLKYFGGEPIQLSSWYWTASDRPYTYAWRWCFLHRDWKNGQREEVYLVRPVYNL